MKPHVFFTAALLCLTAYTAAAGDSLVLTKHAGYPAPLPPGAPIPDYSPRVVCEIKDSGKIEALWKEEAAQFDYKDWSFVVPDSAFYDIEFSHGDQKLKLASSHPAFESNPKLIANSTGISSLEGRTREDAEKADDPTFVKQKKAFDRLMKACATNGK